MTETREDIRTVPQNRQTGTRLKAAYIKPDVKPNRFPKSVYALFAVLVSIRRRRSFPVLSVDARFQLS
jgi:hypothetical protein